MRIKPLLHIVPILLLLLLLFGSSLPCAAVEVGGIGFDVNLGFAGHFRPKTWVPLQVTVTNEGVPFDAHVEAVMSLGNSYTSTPAQVVYRRAVSLPSGTKKQLLLTLPISSTQRPLDVKLVEQNGNVLQSVRIPLLTAGVTADIILVLDTSGERWTWLQEVAEQPQWYMKRSRAYVAHIRSAPELPDNWVGYESVRTIILTDSFPVAQLTEAQLQAILHWVEAGGHLLVAGGAALSAISAPDLATKLPVTITGGTRTVSLKQLGYDVPALSTPYRTVVWNAKPSKGRVDLAVENTPLIAHQWVGAGRITYLGFDLAARPLRTWSGLDAFSRNLVFPPRMVHRATTGMLERNLLPIISTQKVPYPRHLWLFIFAVLYVAFVAGTLYMARTRKVGWLYLLVVTGLASAYVQVVVKAQADRSMRAYGEVRITQVPPDAGTAYSIAMAQMVNMQGGDWVLKQDPGVHIVPSSANNTEPNTVLVVEQGEAESRIGPTEARQALAVTSQSLEEIPLQAKLIRDGETMHVTLDNQSAWMIRDAFYVDRERYISLGDVKAHTDSTTSFPADRFVVASETLSPQWIAASVATVARNSSNNSDSRQFQAMEEIVAHALTPSNDNLDLPWGSPLIIAVVDKPVTPPLAQGFTGLGYHFLIMPLSSLLDVD